MPGDRAAIFVDGGYLDYVVRAAGVFGRVDFAAFFAALTGPVDMMRAYYYHCLPYQSANPTPEEADRFSAQERFFASLDRIPRTEVRKGKLAYRGRSDTGTPIFVQKQVDSLMATDIVMLSAKHLITHAVVVTGDSDLMPALAIAKNEGVIVKLGHGVGRNSPHRELWDQCDERLPLTSEWFAQCLLPLSPPPPP